jgi:glycine hydroxymethyltransferase
VNPNSPTPTGAASAEEAWAGLMGLLSRHEAWRANCLNLIASENVLSQAVHSALDSDLIHRYADYTGRDLAARRYRGTRYVVEIEREVERLAGLVFGAEFFELRPISGHLAGAAVLMALCRPGDTVLEIGRDGGGHREAGKFAGSELVRLDVRHLPIDPDRYNVDAAAAAVLIAEVRPRVVILGSSNFLFPHPVREMRKAIDVLPEAYLVYDASHVMGLIAGGRFQDPLGEGADVVFGSTHKTFFGPQGGIVFTNRRDLMTRISDVVYPGLVTNHHPFRMPALGVALAEMLAFGPAYGDQVIANSQALGEALVAEGIQCVTDGGRPPAGPRYSSSHTVLLRVGDFGTADAVAAQLEAAGIITTGGLLPDALGGHGIRVGTQEMTRRGLRETGMVRVAQFIAEALRDERPSADIAAEVAAFVGDLGPLRFTWPA